MSLLWWWKGVYKEEGEGDGEEDRNGRRCEQCLQKFTEVYRSLEVEGSSISIFQVSSLTYVVEGSSMLTLHYRIQLVYMGIQHTCLGPFHCIVQEDLRIDDLPHCPHSYRHYIVRSFQLSLWHKFHTS